jgi:glutaredoxin
MKIKFLKNHVFIIYANFNLCYVKKVCKFVFIIILYRCHKYSSPPKLTLYTKDACSLCDVVKNELKLKFNGSYQLETINITAPGNEHFKQLYQYEIPVLFLEGHYLCKHKLDVELLERRLLKYT